MSGFSAPSRVGDDECMMMMMIHLPWGTFLGRDREREKRKEAAEVFAVLFLDSHIHLVRDTLPF